MEHRSLKPFASPPTPFSVSVDWEKQENQLIANFSLSGDIKSLNLATPKENPKRIDGLYRTTCLEIFLKCRKRYLEWNFAFSGDWCVFLFDDYRKKSLLDISLDSHLFSITHISHSPTEATLKVSIPLELLTFLGSSPFQLGLSAVIEHPGGILSYWALEHKDTRPNFHLAESFTIQL